MKKSILLAAAAAAGVLTSCNSNSGGFDMFSSIEAFPVKVESGDAWSFINPKGEIVYEDEFDNCPSAVSDGLFSVKEGEGYTVYKYGGKKPEAVKGLDGLLSVGFANNGMIGIVRPNERIAFVDKSGKEIFMLEPYKGVEITECYPMFSEGLLPVKTADDKWGYVDTKGKMVIAPEYYNVDIFNDGYAIAKNVDDEYNATYYILNRKGEATTVKNGITPRSNYFKYGVIAATDNSDDDQRAGFLSTSGEFTKCPSKVKRIDDYTEKVFVYRDDDGNRGVMSRDDDHEVIVRPKYDCIYIIDNNRFLAEKNDRYVMLDGSGDKIHEFDYDRVIALCTYWTQFQLLAMDGNDTRLINNDGRPIGKAEFSDFDLTLCDCLESDYFNAAGLAENIASRVGTMGLEAYPVGTKAEKYFKGKTPEDYVYTNWYSPEDATFIDPQATITESFSTEEAIATSERYIDHYETRGYYFTYEEPVYGYTYSFNPRAVVDGGRIDVAIKKTSTWDAHWKLLRPALLKDLEAKGLNLESEETDEFVVKGGDATITVSKTYDGLFLSIVGNLAAEEIPVTEDEIVYVEVPADDAILAE